MNYQSFIDELDAIKSRLQELSRKARATNALEIKSVAYRLNMACVHLNKAADLVIECMKEKATHEE